MGVFAFLFCSACGGETSPSPSDAAFEVSSACMKCVETCRPQLEACFADPSCMKLTTCINGCDASTSCVTDCQAANASKTFDAYQACAFSCLGECAK
jgi:hypothetical protein